VGTGLRLLVATLVVGCGGRTAVQPVPAPSPLQGRFAAELNELRDEYGLVGATAAYALPDGTLGVAATGMADLERGTVMTPRSRMLAASVGKTFVAATALALAQEGRLELDGRISLWLDDRAWFSRLPNGDSITLRHLLTHTSGLSDHVHSAEFAADMSRRWRDAERSFSPEELVQYVLDKPPLFPAGEQWAYSDTGYILVGLVVESVVDRPFFDEVVARFVEPLRLRETQPSDRRELARLATGYAGEDNPLGLPPKTTVAPGVMAWNPAVEWTGGGLVSAPADLVVWARALYEGKAISGPYEEELFRSVPVGNDGSGVRYGAGVAIQTSTPYGPSYGHGGIIPGYTTSMRYYPAHRVAVAFQINSDQDLDREGTSVVQEMEKRLAGVVVASLGHAP